MRSRERRGVLQGHLHKSTLCPVPQQCTSVIQDSCPYKQRKLGLLGVLRGTLLASEDLGFDANSPQDVGKSPPHFWALSD